ncbi:MAG: class I SAM-dependent methyltransferase [Sphingobacteriaceae bacterium]|nr:MAG: class I SAM-dependent methyltransferase [Sphingobacteriaceae bacterium]
MSKPTTAFYNHFSFFYPVVDVFLKPQKRRLFEEVNKLPQGKLLEIGVGNGAHLNQYKNHDITGIDTSIAMIEHARRNRPENITLIVMNGETLSFPNQQFDYVVLSHVIAVTDNPDRLLQEVYRVLKPQGRIFILNHFTPNSWLKYIDQAVEPLARAFRFKSVFRAEDLKTLQKFSLQKELSVSPASYFKLLIYQK